MSKHLQVTMLHLVLLLASIGWVSCYPSGPPTSACESMFPGHGVSAQNSQSPYSITVSNTSYSPGDTIQVTLSASSGDFRGYMVQARRADPSTDQTEPIGSFQDIPAGGNAQFIECTEANDTFGHTDAGIPVTSLTVTWVAPSSAEGHIRFRATVAQTKTIFWTDVYSDNVEDPTAPTIGPTQTPPSGVTGSSDLVTASGCGRTKGCYADPVDCSNKDDCNNLITWREDGDDIVFQLLGRMDSGNEYIAIGFSNDQTMGDDDVWACINDGGSVTLAHSSNVGRRNVPDTLDGSSGLSGSYVDNVLQCQFTRQRAMATSRRKRASVTFFDLSNQYYLFIASGPKIPQTPPTISKHSTIPIISSSKIDFTSDDIVSGSAGVAPILKAHACLMVIAWVGLCSIGMIIARYFKPMWPNSTLLGEKVWFTLHRSIMIANVLCFSIAFILVFIHVGGFITYERTSDVVFIHAICGILAVCFGIANPIMALFRPHPGTPKRPIFNWAHMIVGNIAYGLAITSVFMGIDTAALDLPKYTTWVMVAYVCFYALMQLLFGILPCLCSKHEKSEGTPLKTYGEGVAPDSGEESSSSADPSDSLIRKIILGIYVFVTSAVVLLLIILIAIH